MRSNDCLKLKKKKITAWKYNDILIWPNCWPGVTRIEVLSSYKPVSGFQVGTVGQTAVTKIEKIKNGFCHYSSYTTHFVPYIYIYIFKFLSFYYFFLIWGSLYFVIKVIVVKELVTVWHNIKEGQNNVNILNNSSLIAN